MAANPFVKSALAFVFALLVILAGVLLMGNPEPPSSVYAAPLADDSETQTAAATSSTTPACDAKPLAPLLRRPEDKTTVNNSQVRLKWSATDCTNKYKILVRRDSANGPVADRARRKDVTQYTTISLPKGHKYYWFIRSCNAFGCTRSEVNWFKLPPPPTPKPSTPNPTPPSGTPAPGDPPDEINNYKGYGVYLSTDGNAYNYFDCAVGEHGLEGVHINQTVYSIALWFYSGEGVTFELQDFTAGGNIVATTNLTADGNGAAWGSTNTGGLKANNHYHLLFTGKTSGAQYCGHFDTIE